MNTFFLVERDVDANKEDRLQKKITNLMRVLINTFINSASLSAFLLYSLCCFGTFSGFLLCLDQTPYSIYTCIWSYKSFYMGRGYFHLTSQVAGWHNTGGLTRNQKLHAPHEEGVQKQHRQSIRFRL